MSQPSYHFVDAVTSDLSFVARGATLEEVFASAADALLAATVEKPASVAPRTERRIALAEPDLELLLLRFLNELVYLRDVELLLLRVKQVRVEHDGEARLEALLVGEPMRPESHGTASEVKAATAYGLRVAPSDEGWEARVTLDV
jgi:SHS2 domain-containing protein